MIEKDLKRIADSLEIIAGVLDDKAAKSFAAEVPLPVEEASAPVVEKAPAPVVEEAPAPAPDVTQMSPEVLNDALVVEFNRLGGREGIDKVIKAHGADTVTTLDPAKYSVVLEEVKALK